MSQIKRLQTIDADTLQSTAYEPVSFVVDDLLPQGLQPAGAAPRPAWASCGSISHSAGCF